MADSKSDVTAIDPSTDGAVPDSALWDTDAAASPLGDEQWQENVGLTRRPSLSIRTRLIGAFALIFALCMVITFWSIRTISRIQAKLHFLEASDTYMSEIQQARRFEKNFLLYGTNRADALEHAQNAEKILRENNSTFASTLGTKAFDEMVGHVTDYSELLGRLGRPGEPQEGDVEGKLRTHGAEMVSFAMELVDKERASVERMLTLAGHVPFVFLVVLLLLMSLIALFLSRQLLNTLGRFTQYAQRIGDGDFSPITPKRKYRDEFSQLAVAFNRMIFELDRRHRVLVESHKLRAIGTLVAGVAHELNNPLNNTLLTASALEEDYLSLSDDEKLEMIRDVIKETERSQRVVRNLLDFARESEVKVVPLALDRIVKNSIDLVANQVRLARIKLRTDFASDLPPVHGDEQMLQQVIINLVLNAVDVLPRGGTITVLTRHVRDNGCVALEVRDNGPGIPDHILPRIFDPFFTTKVKGKGTGLGLSVSQGIVRKLGGYVEVKSILGSGTSFTVFLPATDVPSTISA